MSACRSFALVIAGMVALPAPADESVPPFAARWETGFTFLTKDAALQRLHDAAVKVCDANVTRFSPSMDILVEGGGYQNAWIETQPMGGKVEALAGGTTVFSGGAGIRVVTDLEGNLIELHGISPDKQTVKLEADGRTYSTTVAPNEIHEPTATGIRLKRRAPFTHPDHFTAP